MTSCSGRFSHGQTALAPTVGRVGPKAGLDGSEEDNLWPLPRFEPLTVQTALSLHRLCYPGTERLPGCSLFSLLKVSWRKCRTSGLELSCRLQAVSHSGPNSRPPTTVRSYSLLLQIRAASGGCLPAQLIVRRSFLIFNYNSAQQCLLNVTSSLQL